KHAGSEVAEIEFQRHGDELVISVRDQGRGFDVNGSANGHASARGGNGLPSMHRRAAALGGSYQIISQPGHGTTAVLRVPLKAGWQVKNIFRRRPGKNAGPHTNV